ncbi:thioredoxin domain protein [Bernardetia litoralis DSM 6794]|uniref:Thioredoxin domain protein n=1 Tax=Bernardetia litoralis (strain ATCC 23117 / DSM 6794 / NBRC 15988 / NCIMB 1366 / Fx l1 / Sio-4) TaxID=880071 RepID=I4AQA5_BERLS|nr:thioredoxin family protein [Bernardetia litoralis]AFM06140.1 thioredoxin domain protein [Bernardetia litoralis DSM 6794]
MKKTLFILFIIFTGKIFFPTNSFAQLLNYSFEEMERIQKKNPKNRVIFIHTDWCKYCQKMKNTTFENEKIINLLNNKFYYVDFDAEENRDIKFVNHTFKYKPTGTNTGVHELATQLGTVNGKLSYPTLCILNEKNEIIFQYDQFLSSSDLLNILKKI